MDKVADNVPMGVNNQVSLAAFTLLLLSKPLNPPRRVVLTDWLSMMTTGHSLFLPLLCLISSRKHSIQMGKEFIIPPFWKNNNRQAPTLDNHQVTNATNNLFSTHKIYHLKYCASCVWESGLFLSSIFLLFVIGYCSICGSSLVFCWKSNQWNFIRIGIMPFFNFLTFFYNRNLNSF